MGRIRMNSTNKKGTGSHARCVETGCRGPAIGLGRVVIVTVPGLRLCICPGYARAVVKKVDFGRNDQENLPIRRPNSTRRLPTGNRARTYRTGPHSSHSAGLNPRISLSRIESASPHPQPVLRCKRWSQLPRDRTPVRPHVLHSLPCRYGEGGRYDEGGGYDEGDMGAIADGCNSPARDAL